MNTALETNGHGVMKNVIENGSEETEFKKKMKCIKVRSAHIPNLYIT